MAPAGEILATLNPLFGGGWRRQREAVHRCEVAGRDAAAAAAAAAAEGAEPERTNVTSAVVAAWDKHRRRRRRIRLKRIGKTSQQQSSAPVRS